MLFEKLPSKTKIGKESWYFINSLKNSSTQENIRNSRLKMRLWNLYEKEYIKLEINPMTENLQD